MAVTPGSGQPDWFPQADKLRHLLAFLGFAALVVGGRLRPRRWWLLGLVLYGVAIEWAQSQVPGRDASVADALADGAGVLLGAWLARPLWRRLCQRFTPESKTPPEGASQN